MTRDKGDLIAGAVLAAFGAYVIWVAAKLPYVSDVGPGHGFFPLWLGIGLVVFAAGLMFESFTSSVNKAKSSSWNSMVRPLAGWLAVMVAIALLGRIGFALSFVILTVFLVVALDRRPALLAVGVALGLALTFHLVFVVALDVSLPKAVWGF
jgi:putative tricarboxylic transport membrane protein